jgi:ATP-dependent DNA helicase RecG
MTLPTLHDQILLGEDSSRQFKADLRNAESLAAEMVAFSNSSGGTLYIGLTDDGTMPGLSAPDVARINQLISNTATPWSTATIWSVRPSGCSSLTTA